MITNKGFSIIEVLVTVFILAGLAYFATTIFQTDKTFQKVNQTKISSTYNIQNIIGRIVSKLKDWNGNASNLSGHFGLLPISQKQIFRIYEGSSGINNIVDNKVKSNCSLAINGNTLNFCLFSTNSKAEKVDDAMISAKVIHLKTTFLDMRDNTQISPSSFAGSTLTGGKIKYFFHSWTKVNNKNIKSTIRGVFYFAK